MDIQDAHPSTEGRLVGGSRGTPVTRSRPPSPWSKAVQPMEGDLHPQQQESTQGPELQEGNVSGVPIPAESPDQGGDPARPLNVSDALSYLDSVKLQFAEQPEVYNKFLDIMKDFKSQLIDTPGVIERVSNLFHGHPALIQGFNTFLPTGYRIETSDNLDPNYITVTTPAGTTTQATNAAFKYSNKSQPATEKVAGPSNGHEQEGLVVSQETLKPALEFVQKIRTRYANQPDVYRQFLVILAEASGTGTAQSKSDIRGMESWSVACLSAKYPQGDVMDRIMGLLKDSTELMRDFVQFLPDEQMQKEQLTRIVKMEESRKASEPKPKRGDGHVATSSAAGQKRKRKPVEREKEKEPAPKASTSKKAKVQATSEAPSPALTQRQAAAIAAAAPVSAAPPSPLRAPPQLTPQAFYPHHQQTVPLPQPIAVPIQATSSIHPSDEAHFFERVKRALDNRETYNEFLKLVNLFTQDIINSTRLVLEARSFLGDSELMVQLKDILGWDANKERIAALEETWTRPMGVLDRPNRDQLHSRYGSYRKLPANEVNVQCSGRDEMCNSVLNDEWISQPTFQSEDAGFIAHKKNIYEEALHRSEEERHEYDFHVEAIHRTIQVLEPLNNKIAQLSAEERATFKLKANLAGAGKAIHQRVIKKIYGRELGLEVWGALQEVPATAIPVVLMRLKQKHEEWKRAQREWDKVWREVDARNYHKSLDHQAVTFKTTDKKAITQKAFVTQIEAARDEQRVKRASLIDPLFARTKPRHQLEFVIEDVSVLQDMLKLTLSFLDRTQGQISHPDRKKIETFLRSFVPLFFMVDPVAFNAVFVPHHETVDSDLEAEAVGEDVEIASANGSTSSSRSRGNKKSGANGAGDLRKRLLKSEQAKSSRRTRAQEAASPTPSRFVSPAPSDAMQVDGEGGNVENGIGRNENSGSRRRGTFYTNTTFYVLLRLHEVLYSRLRLFKNLTKEMADRGNDPFEPNPASIKRSIQADLAKLGDRLDHSSHFYELMLESCEKLFDNELEQSSFEEMMRYMFGLKHAFKLFTIDKVIGALIKQVQTILSDPRSQDLYELLRREREISSPTTQDLINSRRNTERILGPDENLFRIDWLPESKTMTIQLIGKDDTSYDGSEVMTGRWQAYIESFVSHHYTAGVPTSSTIRRPFLLRTKVPSPSGAMPDIIARGGLQIKVCVRTYRLFFVSRSEDIMFRISSSEERSQAAKLAEVRSRKRQKWLEEYANASVKEEPQSATAEVAPKPPVLSPAQPPAVSEPAPATVPESPTQVSNTDVDMEVVRERGAEPEVTVYTMPQDDAVEAAAAAAAAGPATEPDPADVTMEETTEIPAPETAPAAEDASVPEPLLVPPEEAIPRAATPTNVTPLPIPQAAAASEPALAPVPVPEANVTAERPLSPLSQLPPHPESQVAEVAREASSVPPASETLPSEPVSLPTLDNPPVPPPTTSPPPTLAPPATVPDPGPTSPPSAPGSAPADAPTSP